MRKLLIITLLIVAVSCAGCSNSNYTNEPTEGSSYTDDSDLGDNGLRIVPNRFGIIESHRDNLDCAWYILYDKKTGVEYMMVDEYQQQSLSPLYNADGTIMIYDEVL